jgi:prophage regulatory protein
MFIKHSQDRSLRRLVRYKDLKYGVDYSRQHLGRLEADGKWPQRVQIGGNSIGWFEDEILAWMESRQRGPLPVGRAA